MNQFVDDAEDEGGEQQTKGDDASSAVQRAAEQVDQRPEERKSCEDQSADDQPVGKILPLDLVVREVGPVTEKAAHQKSVGGAQQQGTERMKRWLMSSINSR